MRWHIVHCRITCRIVCGYINAAFDKMRVSGIIGNIIDWRGGNALSVKNGQNLFSASRSDPVANHLIDLGLMLYPRRIGGKFWIINHGRHPNCGKKPFGC